MSRTKGYKCFNIKCGSCIGKTLCGEPEDTALVCVDRVIGKPMTNADRIRAMSDEELAAFINRIVICHHLRNAGNCEKCPIHPAKPCDTEGIAEWLQKPAEEGTT